MRPPINKETTMPFGRDHPFHVPGHGSSEVADHACDKSAGSHDEQQSFYHRQQIQSCKPRPGPYPRYHCQRDTEQYTHPPRGNHSPTKSQQGWRLRAAKYRGMENRKVFNAYSRSDLIMNNSICNRCQNTYTDNLQKLHLPNYFPDLPEAISSISV